MKAASQQRRPLSFKEGLQEIKKSWGLASGQAPEETPQQPADSRRARQQRAEAKGERAKERRPGGQQRPRAADAKPQHASSRDKAGGKPVQQSKPVAQQQKQPPRQHQRPRPAKPLPANLSDEERARIERNRQLNSVWNVLAKHYPTFRERLPLKIGVIDELCARHPDLERTLLVSVLKRHVNHPRYHERVAAGGPRYELDGTPSEGPGIEPSHIARANAALARQKAKAEARAQEAAQQQGSAQPAAAAQQPAQVAADVQAPAAPEASVVESADSGRPESQD
ncbi:MAG TPA: ProQ/FINO family protein [Paraburkholderia sp.]|nr:ProQ/FINO family protein [Paraburkholderia sp.]